MGTAERSNLFLAFVIVIITIFNAIRDNRSESQLSEAFETIKRRSFHNGKTYYELGVAVYAHEHKNDSVMLTVKELDRINQIVDSITTASKYKY